MKPFVSFATEGMGRRLAHFNEDIIGLIMDVKQGVCAEHGFGIASLQGAYKDKLRTTTFAKKKLRASVCKGERLPRTGNY